MEEIILKLMGENPKITAGTALGAYGLMLKYLIFDPYKRCNLLVTIISGIFTFGLCAVFPIWISVVDFKDFMDWGLAFLLKMIGAAGSAVAVYAAYKKVNRHQRRKAIERKRNAKS
jgi:hypothetical protein